MDYKLSMVKGYGCLNILGNYNTTVFVLHTIVLDKNEYSAIFISPQKYITEALLMSTHSINYCEIRKDLQCLVEKKVCLELCYAFANTPQPLYNTIVGVHSIICVTAILLRQGQELIRFW